MDAVINSEINTEHWGSDHCPLSLTLNLDQVLPIDVQASKKDGQIKVAAAGLEVKDDGNDKIKPSVVI